MKSRWVKGLHISFFFFLFFCFISLKTEAKTSPNPNDSTNFIIEAKLHYGFVLAHHKSMQHLTTGHFPAFEINFCKQTHGEKPWQSFINIPCMGFSFWYADLRILLFWVPFMQFILI